MFEDYLNRWGLVPDGDPIITHSSRLLPVRQNGVPAILKVAMVTEEKFGGVLMEWWDGDGAAKVFASDGDALLLERAMGNASLAEFARNGRDDEATRIICGVTGRLHAPRPKPLPPLVPLERWFEALAPAAATHGGILASCSAAADELLGTPRDVGVLHGDIHHDNILNFGERGWLAIDPKRLYGERGFDYANLFCNPEHETKLLSRLFARRVELVAEMAGLERKRLLQWILAWSGLSAAWWLGDGVTPDADFTVARLAAAGLGRLIAP